MNGLPHEKQLDTLKAHPRGVLHLAAALESTWADAMSNAARTASGTLAEQLHQERIRSVYGIAELAATNAAADVLPAARGLAAWSDAFATLAAASGEVAGMGTQASYPIAATRGRLQGVEKRLDRIAKELLPLLRPAGPVQLNETLRDSGNWLRDLAGNAAPTVRPAIRKLAHELDTIILADEEHGRLVRALPNVFRQMHRAASLARYIAERMEGRAEGVFRQVQRDALSAQTILDRAHGELHKATNYRLSAPDEQGEPARREAFAWPDRGPRLDNAADVIRHLDTLSGILHAGAARINPHEAQTLHEHAHDLETIAARLPILFREHEAAAHEAGRMELAKGPRILSRCPACGNDTLTLNAGHLLCTWHECPDPTRLDREHAPAFNGRRSSLRQVTATAAQIAGVPQRLRDFAGTLPLAQDERGDLVCMADAVETFNSAWREFDLDSLDTPSRTREEFAGLVTRLRQAVNALTVASPYPLTTNGISAVTDLGYIADYLAGLPATPVVNVTAEQLAAEQEALRQNLAPLTLGQVELLTRTLDQVQIDLESTSGEELAPARHRLALCLDLLHRETDAGDPPREWYTPGEFFDVLARSFPLVVDGEHRQTLERLSRQYAANLQSALEKGFSMAAYRLHSPAALLVELGSGAGALVLERRRQVEVEGYTAEDDQRAGPLGFIRAACCYAEVARSQAAGYIVHQNEPSRGNWPWSLTFWKPSADPRRNIEKAGALLAAAWDVLRAQAEKKGSAVSVSGRTAELSDRIPPATPGAAVDLVACSIDGKPAVFDLVSRQATFANPGDRLWHNVGPGPSEQKARTLPGQLPAGGAGGVYRWFPLLGVHLIRF